MSGRLGVVCRPKGSLDLPLAQVVATDPAGLRILRTSRCRKDVLPLPFALRSRILRFQGVGQMDSSISFFEVLPMKLPNDPEVLPQRRLERGGKHGCPILAPLPIPDGDLVLAEVDVFDPQAQAFQDRKSVV